VRLPGKKPQKTSAEAEAEALMADLQSPSEMRRRGAKSALGWMTFGDESVYDSYSDSVAVAEEWEGVAEAAVDAELLEVLHELRLERYAASLARLGVESLADVGKRTPNALMTIGMAPGECHALFTELLLGQAQPVPRVRGEEFWSPNREPLLAPNTTARNPGPRARGRGAQSPQSPELEAEQEERASQSSSGWGGSPPRPSSPGLRHTRESLGRDDDSADPRMTKTGTWMGKIVILSRFVAVRPANKKVSLFQIIGMFRLAICWGWTETAIGTQAGSGGIARGARRGTAASSTVRATTASEGGSTTRKAAAGPAAARGAQTCRGMSAQADGGTQS